MSLQELEELPLSAFGGEAQRPMSGSLSLGDDMVGHDKLIGTLARAVN